MNGLNTLNEAFSELQRRADAAFAGSTEDDGRYLADITLEAADLATAPARGRSRLPLVAASIATVAVVTAGGVGFVLFSRDTASTSGAAGSGSKTVSAVSAAAAKTPATAGSAAFQIPQTPAELAGRFRTVLGTMATFKVTDTGAAETITLPSGPKSVAAGADSHPPTATRADPSASGVPGVPSQPSKSARIDNSAPQKNGAAIVGTLTSAGTTGGFDLQIYQAGAGEKAWCDDPDRADCVVKRLADGSSLAIGNEQLEGAGNGVTYSANLIRPDGVELLMHVSNEASPKGASTVLATHPPLTSQQLTEILTSSLW
ncbi:hypothetical protein ACSMXN_22595 [Jatrophihabitans sp. DSM 45814]